MVSPAVPVPCTVMLVRLVMRSLEAPAAPLPVSSAVARVGAAGAAEGAALAKVSVTGLLAVLTLPARSVCLAVKVYAPLLKVVGKLQVVPLVMTVLPMEVTPSNTSMVAPSRPVPLIKGLAAEAPVTVVKVGAATELSTVMTKLALTTDVAEPMVWLTLRLCTVPSALAARAGGVYSHTPLPRLVKLPPVSWVLPLKTLRLAVALLAVMLLSTPLMTMTGWVLLVMRSVALVPVSSPDLRTGAASWAGSTVLAVPALMVALDDALVALTLPARSVWRTAKV